jgi:hypothetical protein
VQPGTITTIAAIGTAEAQMPAVAIPRIDRWYDQPSGGRGRLWDLAYAALTEPIRQSDRDDWLALLDEIEPPTEAPKDTLPMPDLGLRYLIEQLEHLQQKLRVEDAEDFVSHLRKVDEQFQHYERESDPGRQDSLLQAIRGSVASCRTWLAGKPTADDSNAST